MKSKVFQSILSVGLAAMLMLTPVSLPLAASGDTISGSAVSAEGNAQITSKDEVIYATLGSEGSVRAMYTINHFAIGEAGSITDYGDYSLVTNLTDTMPLTQNGDAVTIETTADNFYYQGDMVSTDLPWIFDISYSLDGVKTAPQELGGKSGDLEIHILTKQNNTINATFYESYLLQISVTLDTGKCCDIKAPGATIASAGKNKVITYTVMPGRDADIALSASVRDFSMTGIDITALPFSMIMDLSDADNMINDFTELADAISALNDGVGELAVGVAELNTGADRLKNGSVDIKTGLAELSGNSGQLIQASSQIKGALSQITSALDDSSVEMDLGDLVQLSQGLSQLATGLDGTAGGLLELKNAFAPAYMALDGAIQGIPEVTLSQEQITALYAQTDPSQHDLLDQLIASYSAGQTVKGTYNQVKGAFDAVVPTVDLLSASISTISATLDDLSVQTSDGLSKMDMTQQLTQLSAGLSELAKNYTVFHEGLSDYMNGIGRLSSGYADFHDGLSLFSNGSGELDDGVIELYDGTTKLSDETAKMPDTIRATIDDLLKEYTGSDFKPSSFTSSKNEYTELVQFVLKCDGIEQPEKMKDNEVESLNDTLWDRLIALFTGKEKE